MNKGGRPVIYIPYTSTAHGRLLEDSIENVYEKSKGNEEIQRSSKWILAHVKRMSNGKSEDSKDYEDYYEEMEWRLVHDESPDNRHFSRGDDNGIHRLEFKTQDTQDIKAIIFPDERTKQMSLQDETIRKYFSEHMPIMPTLDDCSDF